MAYSPDGRRALSGSISFDSVVRVWDIATAQTLRTFKGHTSSVNSVAYSPDGRRALSGSGDNTLRLWDIATGGLLRTFYGHTDDVNSVAYSPDGRRALSGSADGTLRVWDIATGGLLRTFGGTHDVHSVAYSPDGRRALSGSRDKTVRLWDIATDRMLATFKGHRGDVTSVAYSPDGRTALSGSADNTLRLWPLPQLASDEQLQATLQQKTSEYLQQQRRFEPPREKHRLIATAMAVREVYGHPVLEALTNNDNNPKYDPEAGRMYLSFRHQYAEQAQEWVFQVPPGAPANELYEGLQAGSVTASTHYQLEEDRLVLDAVYAHHGLARYPGKPVGAGQDYSLGEAIPVVIGERKAFNDDIAQKLERFPAAKIDPNKWLFVIGAEKYQETHDIAFSRRSAELFAQVARKTLGIAKKRSKILLNEDATSGAISGKLKRLLQEVDQEDSIYFYFSGHGIPVPTDGNKPYILPVDVSPEFIGDNQFYRIDSIIRLLQKSKVRQVFLFMDSCFSGQADSRPVFENMAATLRSKKLRIKSDGKLAVLTAGTQEQFSNAYPEKGHRMFSYFLMRELLKGHKTFGALALQVQAQVADQTEGGGILRQNPDVQGNLDLQL